MTSRERLQQIRERVEKSTPGPWTNVNVKGKPAKGVHMESLCFARFEDPSWDRWQDDAEWEKHPSRYGPQRVDVANFMAGGGWKSWAEELAFNKANKKAYSKRPSDAVGCWEPPESKALQKMKEEGTVWYDEDDALANAEFSAHAREDVPWLLERVALLEGLLEDVRDETLLNSGWGKEEWEDWHERCEDAEVVPPSWREYRGEV